MAGGNYPLVPGLQRRDQPYRQAKDRDTFIDTTGATDTTAALNAFFADIAANDRGTGSVSILSGLADAKFTSMEFVRRPYTIYHQPHYAHHGSY